MNPVSTNRRILPIAVWATLFAVFLLACYVVSYPVYMRWRFGPNPGWRVKFSSAPVFAPMEFVMDRSQSVTAGMIWISDIVGTAAVRRYRLERSAPLNVDQRLIVACNRVDVSGVRAALKDGANPNGRFGYGNLVEAFDFPWASADAFTPLLALCCASDVQPSIRTGVTTEPELVSIRESTRKMRVQHSLEILRLLLARKADLNADDGYGSTALSFAVSEKKLELAKALIEVGASVSPRSGGYHNQLMDSPNDLTPLHEAYWSAELAQLLIDKGADPNAKDSDGRTPLDWAEGQEAEAVLKRYTRKP